MVTRCTWCGSDPQYVHYHDNDWGVPVFDDNLLFEYLTLEGAQAGLSWITVLKKRSNYQKVFKNFNIKSVAKFTPDKIEKILENPSIIRNRLKVESTVSNAKIILNIQKEFGSFSHYIWSFVEHIPLQNTLKSHKDLPASTPLSDSISKDMKKRGLRFVGTTIIYAFMQAVGMVNDHVESCFRYKEVKRLARNLSAKKI